MNDRILQTLPPLGDNSHTTLAGLSDLRHAMHQAFDRRVSAARSLRSVSHLPLQGIVPVNEEISEFVTTCGTDQRVLGRYLYTAYAALLTLQPQELLEILKGLPEVLGNDKIPSAVNVSEIRPPHRNWTVEITWETAGPNLDHYFAAQRMPQDQMCQWAVSGHDGDKANVKLGLVWAVDEAAAHEAFAEQKLHICRREILANRFGTAKSFEIVGCERIKPTHQHEAAEAPSYAGQTNTRVLRVRV